MSMLVEGMLLLLKLCSFSIQPSTWPMLAWMKRWLRMMSLISIDLHWSPLISSLATAFTCLSKIRPMIFLMQGEIANGITRQGEFIEASSNPKIAVSPTDLWIDSIPFIPPQKTLRNIQKWYLSLRLNNFCNSLDNLPTRKVSPFLPILFSAWTIFSSPQYFYAPSDWLSVFLLFYSVQLLLDQS